MIDHAVRQGRHGWQGPQGLGLAWILQNRKFKGQLNLKCPFGVFKSTKKPTNLLIGPLFRG